MRQKRAFLPDMQFQWSYTINPDFARDMFFSEFVPAAVSAVSGAWRRMPGAARVCELPGRALTFFIPHSACAAMNAPFSLQDESESLPLDDSVVSEQLNRSCALRHLVT